MAAKKASKKTAKKKATASAPEPGGIVAVHCGHCGHESAQGAFTTCPGCGHPLGGADPA